MISDKNDEALWLYISESEQHVLTLDRLLRRAEKAGELSSGNTAEAFRLIHSLKGASAMMRFSVLEEYSHNLEDVFSKLRTSGGAYLTSSERGLLDACYGYSDYFLDQLERLKVGKEINANAALSESIKALSSDKAESEKSALVKETVSIIKGSTHIRVALRVCPMPHIRLVAVLKSVFGMCGYLATDPAEPQKHSEMNDKFTSEGLDVFLVPGDGVSIDDIVKKLASQPFVRSALLVEKKSLTISEATLRVTQSRINSLLALLDEIAATQSMLAVEFAEAGIQADRLLTKIRRDAAEARDMTAEMGMVEIGAAFGQMRRLVRSMAREFGRKADVETMGDDIYVDSSALDAISDALIHIVRNAVDHGIEPASERTILGKPETGKITLSAQKTGGAIRICVSDDGSGINRAAVMEKAKQLGLVNDSEKDCTDARLFSILASPGFSTNTSVTKYSGRGVGLDTAVRRIRELRGEVTMTSNNGKGTTFIISIPTSLTVRHVLCAEIDGCRAALPVSEICAVTYANQSNGDGNCIHKGRVYRRLATGGKAYDEDSDVFVLFMPHIGDYYIRVKHTETPLETLVKPIPACASDALGSENIYSGYFIENDGRIVCVLDLYKLTTRNMR